MGISFSSRTSLIETISTLGKPQSVPIGARPSIVTQPFTRIILCLDASNILLVSISLALLTPLLATNSAVPSRFTIVRRSSCAAAPCPANKTRNNVNRLLIVLSQAAFTDGALSLAANLSFQRILPVACITTNSVMIDPTVMARPVKPFRKNAYEKATR